jgi:hypothetical protein
VSKNNVNNHAVKNFDLEASLKMEADLVAET